jgi:hypothetical protein
MQRLWLAVGFHVLHQLLSSAMHHRVLSRVKIHQRVWEHSMKKTVSRGVYFLFGLLFYLENESKLFFRNVNWLPSEYRALFLEDWTRLYLKMKGKAIIVKGRGGP